MKDAAYRILIVDDDEEVRNGLAEIVDWKSCGFQVAAALKDGEEAIRYLQDASVDVVLSDIRMTFVSGLHLAKHIYERRIPAKVVLISGYQEFELAKEALRYNVQEYLLKPTDLDEVYKVFRGLKEELDRERQDRNRMAMDREMREQMMRYLKERYLPHLLLDPNADEDTIVRQFEMIGLHIDPRTSACGLVRVSWSSASPAETVQRALLGGLTENASTVTLLPYGPVGRPLTMLAVGVDPEKGELSEETDRILDQASSRLRSLIGLTIEWQIETVYDRLIDFLEERRSSRLRTATSADDRPRRWKEDKRRWTECLEAGRFEEASRLLKQYIATYGGERIDDVKSILIQLFGSLNAVYAADSGGARLMQLCKSEDLEEIGRIGESLLQGLNRRDEGEAGLNAESERKVISKAKQYIRENIGKDLTLSDVADFVYLNPVYLSRLFKLETGSGFSDYVTEVRMLLAAQLLRDTNLKIYEICEKAGYKDVRHFYKLFKRYAGLSPSEYRERAD